MGALDEVDLCALALSREEEERELKAGGPAAGAAAPDARRPDRRAQAGAAALRRLRGLGRGRQGRRDQAPGRAAGPPPRPRRPVRGAERTTRSATTSSHRFWAALPGWGGMSVYDRSWYGRVLVERVEGYAEPGASGSAPTRRSTSFERMLAEEGMILVKIWLQISAEEQLKRFEAPRRGPAEGLEADRRTTGATARSAPDYEAGGRGDARADRPAEQAPWHLVSGRVEALRAGRGDARW